MKKKVLGALLGTSMLLTGIFGFTPQKAEAFQQSERCIVQGHWDQVYVNGELVDVMICNGAGPQLCVIKCNPVIEQ